MGRGVCSKTLRIGKFLLLRTGLPEHEGYFPHTSKFSRLCKLAACRNAASWHFLPIFSLPCAGNGCFSLHSDVLPLAVKGNQCREEV